MSNVTPAPESPAVAEAPAGGNPEGELSAAPEVKVDPTKDLWTNITANVKEAVVSAEGGTDATVLVVGGRGSGKTSIIQRMLGGGGGRGASGPKPTTALEYSYGKREERSNVQLAHFWELAQGTELSQLADVVLTPENVHATTLVIVVDCADPGAAWGTCCYWLKRLDAKSQEMFQKMRAKGSGTPDKLLQRARRRIGEDHPDLKRLRASGIPTVIIANKLDRAFAPAGGPREEAGGGMDTARMKLMARTLRYLAHLYGASLIFTSDNEREVTRLRALMNSIIFGTPFEVRLSQTDSEKGGVLVPSGSDAFAAIGDPNPTNMANVKSSGDAELDRWRAPYEEAFPPPPGMSADGVEGSSGNESNKQFLASLYAPAPNGYSEPAIDAMRKQKAEELEQYRRNAAAQIAASKATKEQKAGKKEKKDRAKDGDE